jgi:hypothetical protein
VLRFRRAASPPHASRVRKERSEEDTGTWGHRYLKLHFEESRFPGSPCRRLLGPTASRAYTERLTPLHPQGRTPRTGHSAGRAGHSPSRSQANAAAFARPPGTEAADLGRGRRSPPRSRPLMRRPLQGGDDAVSRINVGGCQGLFSVTHKSPSFSRSLRRTCMAIATSAASTARASVGSVIRGAPSSDSSRTPVSRGT